MFDFAKANRRISGLQATSGEFLPIDAVELAEQMKLAERGEGRGKKNLPSSDTEIFDDTENEIIGRICIELKQARNEVSSLLSVKDEKLQRINAIDRTSEYKTLARQAVSEFSANIRTAMSDLYIKKRYVNDANDDLKRFQNNNNVYHVARLPNSFKLIAVLLVAFVIESYVNGTFLAEYNQMGLLGGWTEALLFSGLTIFCGFMAGYYGWRFIHQKPVIKKISGFFITLFFTVLLLLIALSLAHLREALEALPQDRLSEDGIITQAHKNAIEPMKLWWISVWDSQQGIQNLLSGFTTKSLLLLALSFAVGLVAMLKGFYYDDSTPGYSKIWILRHNCEIDYIQTAEEKIESLKMELDEYVERIRAEKIKINDNIQFFPEIYQSKVRLFDLYNEHVKHLEQVANTLLSVYREHNKMARKEPAPKHFNSPWRFGDEAKLNLTKIEPKLSENDANVIKNALEKSTELLHEAFDKTILEVKHLNEIRDDAEVTKLERENSEQVQEKNNPKKAA